ncbi:phage tail tube protein [Brachybacterium hainanense]|uniref:Phage tail protein n=1 Tax=Brachybacterium hainanense TaxID=1541174 RepID=A0ABV6R991_9MICO
MSTPIFSPTGVDGVIASGNVPTWIIQEESIPTPLTKESTTIPLAAFNAATTVKADCHHDMGDVSFTRTATTRDRKRACETVTVTVKTGETIEGTVSAVYDQQQLADAAAIINAVYQAVPEGKTVYVAMAFGWDSHKPIDATTIVDVYRGTVQMRSKNTPVDGEDLKFTSTLATDLYIEDVEITGTAG